MNSFIWIYDKKVALVFSSVFQYIASNFIIYLAASSLLIDAIVKKYNI